MDKAIQPAGPQQYQPLPTSIQTQKTQTDAPTFLSRSAQPAKPDNPRGKETKDSLLTIVARGLKSLAQRIVSILTLGLYRPNSQASDVTANDSQKTNTTTKKRVKDPYFTLTQQRAVEQNVGALIEVLAQESPRLVDPSIWAKRRLIHDSRKGDTPLKEAAWRNEDISNSYHGHLKKGLPTNLQTMINEKLGKLTHHEKITAFERCSFMDSTESETMTNPDVQPLKKSPVMRYIMDYLKDYYETHVVNSVEQKDEEPMPEEEAQQWSAQVEELLKSEDAQQPAGRIPPAENDKTNALQPCKDPSLMDQVDKLAHNTVSIEAN